MFGFFRKGKKALRAHEKITQLIYMASNVGNVMGKEKAIDMLRHHPLIANWHEEEKLLSEPYTTPNYTFRFTDPDLDDFIFSIMGEIVDEIRPQHEMFGIDFWGERRFTGFYGRASIPKQKYIVKVEDLPQYRTLGDVDYKATWDARLLVRAFVLHSHALDTSRS